MSWFARIEEACAGFIERAFANMFPSDVEPAQIARKLVATMEARTQSADNGAMAAPSRYAVYVHPSDYQRLLPHRQDRPRIGRGDIHHRPAMTHQDGAVLRAVIPIQAAHQG